MTTKKKEHVTQPESWPTERLVANPRNYRRHTTRQIRELQASLRRWGWRKISISARPSDGLMMTGHGMLEAAKREGMPEVPVLPYECSDAEANAWLAADNELSRKELVDDDHAKLVALLDEINSAGGLDGIGWNRDELNGLRDLMDSPDDDGTKQDDAAKIDEWETSDITVRERILIVLDLPFGERDSVKRKITELFGCCVLGVKALVEEPD